MTTESQLTQAERDALEDERRIALYPDEPELHDIIRIAKYDNEMSTGDIQELLADFTPGGQYWEIDEDTDKLRPLSAEECRRLDRGFFEEISVDIP